MKFNELTEDRKNKERNEFIESVGNELAEVEMKDCYKIAKRLCKHIGTGFIERPNITFGTYCTIRHDGDYNYERWEPDTSGIEGDAYDLAWNLAEMWNDKMDEVIPRIKAAEADIDRYYDAYWNDEEGSDLYWEAVNTLDDIEIEVNKLLDAIEDYVDCFIDGEWDCYTSYCFADEYLKDNEFFEEVA